MSELHPADQALVAELLGDTGPRQRRAMAKIITLLESTRAADRARADALLPALLPHAGGAFRIGVSGVPGVGKSTLIEALGLHLIGLGHRVAVLAVDPSSTLSGGSILGDKTRMERLSVRDEAFIRPSPSSGTLGGVAEKTRESILVCEAAGYDVVIVETVGVGQSELAVAGMTDLFMLLQLPNAGDDLQAIKRGVMEVADLIVVNKADLDEAAARRAQAQIAGALRMLGISASTGEAEGCWQPEVLCVSALHPERDEAVVELWRAVQRFRDQCGAAAITARRQRQDIAWMWERIHAGLTQQFNEHPKVKAALPGLTRDVRDGRLPPSVAARRLLELATERDNGD